MSNSQLKSIKQHVISTSVLLNEFLETYAKKTFVTDTELDYYSDLADSLWQEFEEKQIIAA